MSWGFCTQGGLRNCRQRLAAWRTVLPCPLRVAAVDKSKTDLQSALACAKELWNNFINFIWVISELFAMAAIFIYIQSYYRCIRARRATRFCSLLLAPGMNQSLVSHQFISLKMQFPWVNVRYQVKVKVTDPQKWKIEYRLIINMIITSTCFSCS